MNSGSSLRTSETPLLMFMSDLWPLRLSHFHRYREGSCVWNSQLKWISWLRRNPELNGDQPMLYYSSLIKENNGHVVSSADQCSYSHMLFELYRVQHPMLPCQRVPTGPILDVMWSKCNSAFDCFDLRKTAALLNQTNLCTHRPSGNWIIMAVGYGVQNL